MTETQTEAELLEASDAGSDNRKRWFAAGGMIGAILASSCCIAPLALVTLGISGAWIGTLAALEAYKPWFAGVALVFIGLGFRQVYRKPKAVCVEGSYCAQRQSSLITKSALWIATGLVLAALTISCWAPLLY